MKKSILENHYVVIKNFIPSERAKNLSDEFKEYCKSDDVSNSDTQVPNTPAKYNYLPFLELLCEKTPEVSKIIDETVLPTYCYARVYKNGDELKPHTDRPACEISLTVHLDGDKNWKFYLKTPFGNEVSINLEQGDALLYLGCDTPHWRNIYEGKFYSQVFLHYVRSRGEKSYAHFDNRDKNIFRNFIEVYKHLKL